FSWRGRLLCLGLATRGRFFRGRTVVFIKLVFVPEGESSVVERRFWYPFVLDHARDGSRMYRVAGGNDVHTQICFWHRITSFHVMMRHCPTTRGKKRWLLAVLLYCAVEKGR